MYHDNNIIYIYIYVHGAPSAPPAPRRACGSPPRRPRSATGTCRCPSLGTAKGFRNAS